MILVDASVWIDHLRTGSEPLAALLIAGRVLGHPFVVGELACGNVRNRDEVLTLIASLPQAPAASHPEVLFFIERHALMGRGIGYVDVHLLASASLDGTARLWTRDQRLDRVARTLEVAYTAG